MRLDDFGVSFVCSFLKMIQIFVGKLMGEMLII